MDGVGAASAILGLAIPVFQSAKALRDRIRLVASEKLEFSAVLVEYEKDISLLESLYNDHKELLDRHHLDTDLKELEWTIRDLDEWLNSINPSLGKNTLPSLKEIWKSGDLREKMVAANTVVASIRNRWQMRLQVCMLVSTTAISGNQAEIAAMLHQMMYMLQQGPIRQRTRTLSMHSQIEPAGFNSQTTRVIANTTTSVVTFSILSPDASLSYDLIKLRFNQYRTLLASDSDTIELPTENGKTVICWKQANEMREFLDQAETLLQDIVHSRDISTLVVLCRLRDLAEVLDKLKLYDECRLMGNCALDLAEALVRRSHEFKNEQAETLALIAGLSVYQPRARTFFIQAISLCEEAITVSALDNNKFNLLVILRRASKLVGDDYLCLQWMEYAVNIMTKELPSSMVPDELCGVVYNNYGLYLNRLGQYASAVEAYHTAVLIRRTLASMDPVKYNSDLALSLMNMGLPLRELGKYDDSAALYKEALELCRTVSAQEPFQYAALQAKILYNYGITLVELSQISEAAEVAKEAVSLYRGLAQTRVQYSKWLYFALYNYGRCCHLLGKNAEAVFAYQESISLKHCLVATDPERSKYLRMTLHNMANSLRTLGQNAEADAAANEALQIKVLDACSYAPNFSLCFVCQRVERAGPPTSQSDTPAHVLAIPASLSSPTAETSREQLEIGASLLPAQASLPAHILPTQVDPLGLGQLGVAPNPVGHLDSAVPSASCLSSSHPQVEVVNSVMPTVIGGRSKALLHRLFTRNRV